MEQARQHGDTRRSSLTLVLYGERDPSAVRRAVRDAEQGLAELPLDYEILVIGGTGNEEVKQAIQEETARSPAVRYVAGAGSSGYGAALRTALSACSSERIVVTNGALDLTTLRYLIPLAQGRPLAVGCRTDRRGPLTECLLSWAGNTTARLLMGTAAHDCGGAAYLSVFQREVLAEVLPEAEGTFAPAEVIARARGKGFEVAELPVSADRGRDPGSPRGWRDLSEQVVALLRPWWRFHFPGPAPSPPGKGSWLLGVLLALLAALVLWPGNQPLLEPDEGRQAEIPREMFDHGDLLVPRIQGLPYHEKPPLQYWLTAGAYALFGVRPWVARLVPAAAAWLSVLLTFTWARRALGPRPAFLSGLVLCLSVEFVFLGRTVTLDSLLAVCVAAAWYAAHAAVARPALRGLWWAASALACGLGVLAKGPVALILLVPPVLAYQWLTPSAARPRPLAWAVYLLLAVLVPAPWYVLMGLHDPTYLGHFFWKANIVRFVNPYDHEQPWWFYLPVLFVGTFPWSLLWAALGVFLVSHQPRLAGQRTPALGFCLFLAVWCILFFSVSGCKSPPYVLPALAPLALLLGVCLEVVLFRPAAGDGPLLVRARQLLPCQATVTVLLLAAGVYGVAALAHWQPWRIALVPTFLAPVLALACWRYGRHWRPVLAWGVCAAASLAFLLWPAQDLGAGYAGRHSPQRVTRLIRHGLASRTSPVVSFQRTWPSASFYLRREIASFYGEHLDRDLLDLLKRQPEVLVLVENDHNLRVLLNELGEKWDTEVVCPDPGGTVALVIVRHSSGRSD